MVEVLEDGAIKTIPIYGLELLVGATMFMVVPVVSVRPPLFRSMVTPLPPVLIVPLSVTLPVKTNVPESVALLIVTFPL
jgi:hypothetical protein